MTPALQPSTASTVATHDFTVEQEKGLLIVMSQEVGIPPQLTSYMYTFIKRGGKTLVLLGHPPRELIEEALSVRDRPSRLLINQEEMHNKPQSYDVWAFRGQLKRFPIAMSVSEALRRLE